MKWIKRVLVALPLIVAAFCALALSQTRAYLNAPYATRVKDAVILGVAWLVVELVICALTYPGRRRRAQRQQGTGQRPRRGRQQPTGYNYPWQ